jgi:hypothetical protein
MYACSVQLMPTALQPDPGPGGDLARDKPVGLKAELRSMSNV